MSKIEIRKQILSVEKTFHEGGPVADQPLKIGVIANVVKNPFVGRYASVEELQVFVKLARDMANDMVPVLVEALGGVSCHPDLWQGCLGRRQRRVGTRGHLARGRWLGHAGGSDFGQIHRARQ